MQLRAINYLNRKLNDKTLPRYIIIAANIIKFEGN